MSPPQGTLRAQEAANADTNVTRTRRECRGSPGSRGAGLLSRPQATLGYSLHVASGEPRRVRTRSPSSLLGPPLPVPWPHAQVRLEGGLAHLVAQPLHERGEQSCSVLDHRRVHVLAPEAVDVENLC